MRRKEVQAAVGQKRAAWQEQVSPSASDKRPGLVPTNGVLLPSPLSLLVNHFLPTNGPITVRLETQRDTSAI